MVSKLQRYYNIQLLLLLWFGMQGLIASIINPKKFKGFNILDMLINDVLKFFLKCLQRKVVKHHVLITSIQLKIKISKFKCLRNELKNVE
jgi:hypothetical protein